MANEIKKLGKKVKRKRIRIIITGLLITVAAAVVIIVLINIFFVVKNIETDNNTIYDTQELIDASEITGTSIFGANGNNVYEKIYLEYPYVSSVETEIFFPDRVKISFYGTTAVMCVKGEGDKYIILDKDLKVLEEVSAPREDLIIVAGTEFSDYCSGEKLNNYSSDGRLISEIFTNLELYFTDINIKSIDITKKYAMEIILDNITIEIGNGEDIDKKMKMARKVYDDNNPDEKAVINVKDYTKGRYRKENI